MGRVLLGAGELLGGHDVDPGDGEDREGHRPGDPDARRLAVGVVQREGHERHRGDEGGDGVVGPVAALEHLGQPRGLDQQAGAGEHPDHVHHHVHEGHPVVGDAGPHQHVHVGEVHRGDHGGRVEDGVLGVDPDDRPVHVQHEPGDEVPADLLARPDGAHGDRVQQDPHEAERGRHVVDGEAQVHAHVWLLGQHSCSNSTPGEKHAVHRARFN